MPYATILAVYYNGGLSINNSIYDFFGIRPVINLKADTPFESGDYDGTSSKPFTVKLD